MEDGWNMRDRGSGRSHFDLIYDLDRKRARTTFDLL